MYFLILVYVMIYLIKGKYNEENVKDQTPNSPKFSLRNNLHGYFYMNTFIL
jgi:hypothetical protein